MKKIIAIAAVATLCVASISFAGQPSTYYKQSSGKYMMSSSGKYKNTNYYRKAHHKHSCGCNHKG